MKGGKPGLNVRRKGALARLEVTYEAFKKAGEDKRNLITEKLFPTIKKSHAWSMRLQHSNLESITKTKKEDVNDWTGKTHASYSGTRSCKT